MSSRRPLSATSKARNSFRTLFNARKTRPFWKQMQTLRQESLAADYPAICTVTEGNPAYPFPGLGNTFPATAGTIPNARFRHLKPLLLQRELGLQVARLNHHAPKLGMALISLAQINTCLASHDLEQAEAMIASHKEMYGLSFALMKKELLLALERQGLSGLSRRYTALTHGYRQAAWALLCHYVYDMMDPTFDPALAMRAWRDSSAEKMEDVEWAVRLIEDDILTRSRTDADLSSALLRFSALSLLDLAVLIWRKRTAHLEDARFQTAFEKLDNVLKTILNENFTQLEIRVASAYRLSDKAPPDIAVYRTTFFFDDVASVAKWRCQISKLIFPGMFAMPSLDEASVRLDIAAMAVAKTPERCPEVARELLAWEKSFLHPDTEISDQKFLAAALAAESLRRMGWGCEASATAVAHLLASTEDAHAYVEIATLEGLLASEVGRSSLLLRFVLWEMIYRKSRTQDNELERRLAFMNLFKGKSGAQLTELLDQISLTSRETAVLLAKTCTRTFLERLFQMMASVKDVLETRLRVAQWLIARAGEADDSLREECDALSRELENLEARSDLDSTRVHVDEESLREWFNSTQLANAARYTQTVLAEGPATDFGSLLTFFANKEKATLDEDEEEGVDFTAETQIGSEFLLLAIFDSTFKAFASDRTFGLDAYLSRRIRHGTLSGHLMTPITRVRKRLSEAGGAAGRAHNSGALSGIGVLVEEWSRFLANELDHMRKNVIQLKSPAHPEGLVQASWRTAANIRHLDAMIARVRGRIIETGGAYDMFPDLFSLCWDCLESDLAQLRFHVVREFIPRATNRLSELFENLSSREQAVAFEFRRELQAILEGRLEEVCGWFIRPVFRRDRYSLKGLVTSTLSIVRELDDHYAFTEEVAIPDEISINRGSFDVFGDMLFVLVGNAARHGRTDGKIKVSADPFEVNTGHILVKVTSEVSNLEQHRESLSQIRLALAVRDAHAIDKAAVEEGFSGLRKLIGVLLRVRSSYTNLVVSNSEEKLSITFWLILPAEITFVRERS